MFLKKDQNPSARLEQVRRGRVGIGAGPKADKTFPSNSDWQYILSHNR